MVVYSAQVQKLLHDLEKISLTFSETIWPTDRKQTEKDKLMQEIAACMDSVQDWDQ